MELGTPDRHRFLHTDTVLCILHGLNYSVVLDLWGRKTLTQYKIFLYKRHKTSMSFFFFFFINSQRCFCTLWISVKKNRMSISVSLCFLNQLTLLISSEMPAKPSVPGDGESAAMMCSFDHFCTMADLRLPAGCHQAAERSPAGSRYLETPPPLCLRHSDLRSIAHVRKWRFELCLCLVTG